MTGRGDTIRGTMRNWRNDLDRISMNNFAHFQVFIVRLFESRLRKSSLLSRSNLTRECESDDWNHKKTYNAKENASPSHPNLISHRCMRKYGRHWAIINALEFFQKEGVTTVQIFCLSRLVSALWLWEQFKNTINQYDTNVFFLLLEIN